jgi:polyhydroxyalkanoate synthesis regulator phasin
MVDPPEPGEETPEGSSPLALLERMALAGIGAVALTAERADELARDLSGQGEVRRDEVKQTIDEAMRRWRGEAIRLSERAGSSLSALFEQLGLVAREEYEELELRVAQLEHRLRLAEGQLEAPAGRPASSGTIGTNSSQSRFPPAQSS